MERHFVPEHIFVTEAAALRRLATEIVGQHPRAIASAAPTGEGAIRKESDGSADAERRDGGIRLGG